MKKTTLLIFCLLLLCGNLQAKPVDAAHARSAGAAFLQLMNGGQAVELTDLTAATPYREFYTFSLANGGFVLVAADDCVQPILGYSLTSRFVPEGIPEHVDAWLVEYENEIRYYKEHPTTEAAHPDWDALTGDIVWQPRYETAVSPLITTTWNQGGYYNKLCPTMGSGRAPTGCVATATAQVMKFWEHPQRGYGSHSYNHSTGVLSADFDTLYPWSLMPTALGTNSTSAEADAVSLLMYHIGVAVEMGYGANSSGASTYNSSGTIEKSAQTALVEHFKYSPRLSTVWRLDYSTAEWDAILMGELDAGHPLLHSGRGAGGGHAFICDGYDNNGLFHFNWGWGSLYDGYFATGSLNPGVGGVGGNGSGTYNQNNAAVIGIVPSTTFGTSGTVTTSVSGGTGCSVSGAGSYAFGDTVEIHAAAPSGYRFSRWSDGSRANPHMLLMTGGNQSFTAHFEAIYGDTLSYCGNQCAYVSSIGNGSTATWGIMLPATAIGTNSQLTAIQLYVNEGATHNYTIYEGSTSNAVASGSVTFTSSDEDTWQTITLSNPVTLSGNQPVWVSFSATANYPVALTHGSGNTNGLLWGSGLNSIYSSGWQRTCMIRAIVNAPIIYDTVSTLPYTTGFEVGQDRGWEFFNGNLNQWVIGNATRNGGSSALYISNDGGTTNAYTNNQTNTSLATRSFNLAAGQYQLTCDWRCKGEGNYDFMRILLCPGNATPDPSQFNTGAQTARTYVPTGWTDITGSLLNGQETWQAGLQRNFQVAAAGVYKIVILWFNDNSQGDNPPAAIDNFTLERIILPVSTLPYTTGFEAADDCDWEYNNGNPNQWAIGNATNNGGSRALYISDNNGSSNTYTNTQTCFSYAMRSFTLAAGQYDLAFDWKCNGEGNYDFLRVFLCPASVAPDGSAFGSTTQDFRTTTPTGWQDLAEGKLNLQTSWQNALYTFQVATAGDYRVVFMWYNDHSDGNNPPAAIDNVQLGVSQPRFTITATSNNTSWGTVTGGGSYIQGATATLTASPTMGYHFVGWNDGNTQNPRTVTVTADATFTATFAINTYTVSATSGNNTMGTVSGGGTYNHGSTATLTASPAMGYHFVSWNDGNTQNPRTVTVTANATFTATFAINTYAVSVTSSDNTMGTVSGGGTYNHGSTATLTASPATGYHFTGWAITPGYTALLTDNPLSLTVTEALSAIAHFEEDEPLSCNAPTGLTASNIATTEATLAWTAGGTETLWEVDCNGTQVRTASNPYTLTGLTPGTQYTVKVRAVCDQPSDWSATYTFNTLTDVGIEDADGSQLRLYPNPASSTVTIDGLEGAVSIALVDINGRVHSETSTQKSEITIDVAGLARGTYFVRVTGEQVSAIRKLIVR